MPQYEITYTIETWYSVTVEAEDSTEAINKFHNEGLAQSEDRVIEGEELQNSIDYREVRGVRNA